MSESSQTRFFHRRASAQEALVDALLWVASYGFLDSLQRLDFHVTFLHYLPLNKMGFATSDAGQSTWQHRLGSAVTTGIGVAGGVKTAIDVGKAIWGVARYVAPLIV